MPLTEEGRFVFDGISEDGRHLSDELLDHGRFVFDLGGTVFTEVVGASIIILPSTKDILTAFERQATTIAILVGESEGKSFSDSVPTTIVINVAARSQAVFENHPTVPVILSPQSIDQAILKDSPGVVIVLSPSVESQSIIPDERHFAFTFGEAQVYAKPAGKAAQLLRFAGNYELARLPVELEDGTVAYFEDRLTIEAVMADDELEALLDERDAFDSVSIIWLNEDDGRLGSTSLTDAMLVAAPKAPRGGLEHRSLVFSARSLVKH